MTPNDLARFAAKCRFCPFTGCVIWTGGTTSGRGNTTRYGSFWFQKQRWFAHRWAATYIHNLQIDGLTAGHCCPHGHNSLCVQHLRGETLAENVAEANRRRYKVSQSNAEKQYWLLVGLGFKDPPEEKPVIPGVPIYSPPEWFRPFVSTPTFKEVPF